MMRTFVPGLIVSLPKFLKDLHAGNPLAIYSLAGPIVKVIHEFSDNTASLINSRDRGASLLSQLLGSEAADRHIKVEWTLAGRPTST
jgi:hypothetical protein